MRSTLSTLTMHTTGRVRRRTPAKQRSMTLVVRSLRHKWLGKAKSESSSGRSRSAAGSGCRTPIAKGLGKRETRVSA